MPITTPFSPTLGDARQPVAPLAHRAPQVPTFAGARFGVSARCCEARYQDCAFWHITQTAYLSHCLKLLTGSELLRTP